MDTTSLFQCIENPALLSVKSEQDLFDLCNKYPFSSTLQLLYTKNLQNTENIFLNEQLKLAAAYSSDRNTLYNLLHSKKSSAIPAKTESENVDINQSQSATGIHETENNDEIPDNKTKTDTLNNNSELDFLETQYMQEAIGNSIYTIDNSEQSISNEIATTEIDRTIELTFTDWLQTIENIDKKSGIDIMINRLENIETKEAITKAKFFSPSEMAKKSVQENDEIITETLAHIYFLQGNFTKALNAYKKLSLKYPEKKSYFATQIKIIKEKTK